MEITLSNGDIIPIRKLNLYELSINVPFDNPGPYQIVLELDGGIQQVIDYDLTKFTTPPTKPDFPMNQCEANSHDMALWLRYNHYQAALTQAKFQAECTEQHAHDVAQYIIENCVNDDDRDKISISDYPALQQAVLCPEVTGKDISDVLSEVFLGFVPEKAFI